jgi:hypothetical protein
LFAVELGHEPNDPVHGWVRGANVEHHIPRLKIRGGILGWLLGLCFQVNGHRSATGV